MPLAEGRKLASVPEERAQLRAALLAVGDEEILRTPLQDVGIHRALHLRADRRAHRDEEVRILREDRLLRRQVQRLREASPQLREEIKRPAEEGDPSRDLPAAGEAADRLIDDSLEDRGRDILARSAVVQQRLHVRLGEYAAARGDGVDRLMPLGEFIEPRGVRAEEGGHLVEKGPRAAGAGLVHALFGS